MAIIDKQNTLSKTIAILEFMANIKRSVSISDIANKLDLPMATTHRLVHQLLSDKVIEKSTAKRLCLAPRFMDIAISTLNNNKILHIRHLILEQVSRVSQETCNLSIQSRGKVIYFDRMESNWPHKISLPIGSHLPLYCTASGKIFLAFTINRKTKIKSLTLEKKSKNTIVDSDVFSKELKKVRKQKFSIDNQEFIDGMVAIAVPVFLDETPKVPIFSLSIHAPTARKTVEDLQKYLPLLYNAAEDIRNIYNSTH